MDQPISKSLKHFTKHLFLAGKVYLEKNKAEAELDSHLKKMRNSIIRMSLTPSEVDRLKQKISSRVNWERKYALLFKPEDDESKQIKGEIEYLQQELRNEREEKSRIVSENNEKISEMSDSLQSIKHQMRVLHVEKARRQQRLNILENKINKKIDRESYFNS